MIYLLFLCFILICFFQVYYNRRILLNLFKRLLRDIHNKLNRYFVGETPAAGKTPDSHAGTEEKSTIFQKPLATYKKVSKIAYINKEPPRHL